MQEKKEERQKKQSKQVQEDQYCKKRELEALQCSGYHYCTTSFY